MWIKIVFLVFFKTAWYLSSDKNHNQAKDHFNFDLDYQGFFKVKVIHELFNMSVLSSVIYSHEKFGKSKAFKGQGQNLEVLSKM